MNEWHGLPIPTLDGFTGFVPPQGNGTSHVMLVGEAPGEQEARDSIPFHPKAPAGSTLDRLLRRAGLDRDKFAIINTVWSRPPGNYLEGSRIEGEAIASYAPFRDRAFEMFRPRVLVALGNVALKALTSYGGKGAGITQVQGYVCDSPYDGCWVVPTYHPSFLMRGEQHLSGVFIWALQRACEIARDGFVRKPTRYVTRPSLEDALSFERGYSPEQHFLSYDIETVESSSLDEEEVEDAAEDISYNITRISFCYDARDGYAISLPWQPPYVDIARRMLSTAGPKRVWNCPTPDQRVLTSDLCWKLAGELEVGEKLIGFDEEVQAGRRIRRYKETTVTHAESGSATVYCVQLSDGSQVKVTGEHPWLQRSNPKSGGPHEGRNYRWVKTAELRVGSTIRRLFEPWKTETSYEAGVLAGFFIGEGSLTRSPRLSVSAAQNEGETLDDMCASLKRHGFRYQIYKTNRPKEIRHRHLTLRGGAREAARFLGSIRPQRLLRKFKPNMLGVVWPHAAQWLRITSVTCSGIQEIVRLSTDASTYVLEGFGAHNSNFDNPRLHQAGAPIAGRNYDTMWLWKFLQPTLPRSLGFVAPFYGWSGEPWKMTSSVEPERYSCQDAHALQQIADGVDEHLRQRGIHDLAERHVVDVSTVLHKMSSNGLPYSAEKARAFEIELQAKWDERFATLQQRVPDELKPSKQKTGYKKVPKELSACVQRTFKVLGEDMTEQERESPGAQDYGVFEPQGIYTVLRWCLLEPFLPTSPLQVKALIKSFGHKVGTARKTKKETADDDTIKKLLKKCRGSRKERDRELAELLTLIRECRQLSKVLGTYVKGWRPGVDGRIHSTPGFWGKMYRISWRRPNISATIQDKQEEYIASGFRQCVAVSSKRMLVEGDWKGMEAVLVGWFAGDEEYMRLGRLGVHAYMMALSLAEAGKITQADVPQLSWSDEDITAAVKPLKKNFRFEYDQNKHGVHLSNYLGTPFLMNDMFPESFPTQASAKHWQEFYFSTVAKKVKDWHKRTLDLASREARLTNPFGYSMPFYEVYRWNSRFARWELGEDAKSCIAFLPRDTGAAMLKEALLTLNEKHHLADEGIMLATAHDAILGETNENDVDRLGHLLKSVMEAPVPQLNNLVIGADLKVGPCWHEDAMETYTLREVVA